MLIWVFLFLALVLFGCKDKQGEISEEDIMFRGYSIGRTSALIELTHAIKTGRCFAVIQNTNDTMDFEIVTPEMMELIMEDGK